MCKYKGNDGNLMQHWTLCEMLTVAQRHASCLTCVDAHAMAPAAETGTVPSATTVEQLTRPRIQLG